MHISQLSFKIQVLKKSFSTEPLTTLADLEAGNVRGDSPSTAEEVACAIVKIFVDGVEPLVSHFERPCDPFALLPYEDFEKEVDVYTCSCGVAGCAGLHDGVTIRTQSEVVTWTFPLETYQNKLQAPFNSAEGESLVLTFNRVQYLDTLVQMEQALTAASSQHSPLLVCPCDSSVDPMNADFRRAWPQHLAYRAQRRAEPLAVARAFGDMAVLSLAMDTPRAQFRLSPAQLLVAITPEYFRTSEDPADMYLKWEQAGKLMRQTRETPKIFLQSLDWPTVWEQAYAVLPTELAQADERQEPELPLELTDEVLTGMRCYWVA